MKKFFSKNIIPVILAALFLFGLPTHVYAAGAVLTLDPSTGTVSPNCSINVAIKIDTGGFDTDGADAILIYDSNIFTTSHGNITNGTVYQSYSNSVDSAAGKVEIHGIADVDKPFNGIGTLATVKFTVKPDADTSGTSDIRILFNEQNKSDTTESNVVQRGTITDVLDQVNNATYTLSTSGCTTGTGSGTNTSTSGGNSSGSTTLGGVTGKGGTATGAGTVKKTLDDFTKGPAGLFDNTVVVASVGIVLTVLGLIGFALM